MKYPDNYDPEPRARIWFREALSGQLGYFVKKDGVPKIKLDRPGCNILRPYNKRNWIPCDDKRELTDYHVGEITFEADRVLCKILGMYPESRRVWLNLKDNDRQKWIEDGPDDGEVLRRILYTAIKRTVLNIDEKTSKTIDPE